LLPVPRRPDEHRVVVHLQPLDRLALAADRDAGVAVLPAVVLADVEAHDVVGDAERRPGELVHQVPGPVVLRAVVVLQDRLGHPAVEVEPAAVVARAGAVVDRDAALDHEPAGGPGPDADGPAGLPPPQPAVAERGAAVDHAAIDVVQQDAVAAMVVAVVRVAGVVVGDAAGHGHALVGVVPGLGVVGPVDVD